MPFRMIVPETMSAAVQVGQAALYTRAIAALHAMEASPHLSALSLPAFSQREVHLLAQLVLEDINCTPEFTRIIWELSGGWPLYAEQVRPAFSCFTPAILK